MSVPGKVNIDRITASFVDCFKMPILVYGFVIALRHSLTLHKLKNVLLAQLDHGRLTVTRFY